MTLIWLPTNKVYMKTLSKANLKEAPILDIKIFCCLTLLKQICLKFWFKSHTQFIPFQKTCRANQNKLKNKNISFPRREKKWGYFWKIPIKIWRQNLKWRKILKPKFPRSFVWQFPFNSVFLRGFLSRSRAEKKISKVHFSFENWNLLTVVT